MTRKIVIRANLAYSMLHLVRISIVIGSQLSGSQFINLGCLRASLMILDMIFIRFDPGSTERDAISIYQIAARRGVPQGYIGIQLIGYQFGTYCNRISFPVTTYLPKCIEL